MSKQLVELTLESIIKEINKRIETLRESLKELNEQKDIRLYRFLEGGIMELMYIKDRIKHEYL